jgi:Sigma-70 region 2
MSRDVPARVADAAGRPIAELFASEYHGLRRLARLLTRSDALAEDMVQEAVLRLQAPPTRPYNPGGHLNTNHALWRIVFTRMGSHPPTQAYVERRLKEGLSKTEIIRCLKRYVAREVYPHLRPVAN